MHYCNCNLCVICVICKIVICVTQTINQITIVINQILSNVNLMNLCPKAFYVTMGIKKTHKYKFFKMKNWCEPMWES